MKINQEKIRDCLKKKRMYEYELAERFGITRQTYWRRCKLGLWTEEDVIRISAHLTAMTSEHFGFMELLDD